MLEAYANEEASAYTRGMLGYKAPLLDRTDATDIKKFNDLVERSFNYTFPENTKKSELPGKEFETKVEKFVNIAKGFKRAPKQIQNYKRKNS